MRDCQNKEDAMMQKWMIVQRIEKHWRTWMGTALLYGFVLIGVLFPDSIWNEDTVEVTDEQGNVITLSGEELMENLYTTEELTFDLRLLHIFE